MSVVMQSLLLLYRPTDSNTAQAHRSGRLRDLKSFPLGKFKYMGAYLRWFYRKNFRKYVNISPAIWDTSFS